MTNVTTAAHFSGFFKTNLNESNDSNGTFIFFYSCVVPRTSPLLTAQSPVFFAKIMVKRDVACYFAAEVTSRHREISLRQFKVISFGIKRPAGAIIQSRPLFIPISFPCAALSPLPSRICLVLTNLIIMFITNLLPIRSIIAAFVTNLPHSDKSHHPFCAAYTCLSSLSLRKRHFISKRLDKFQSLPSPFIRS